MRRRRARALVRIAATSEPAPGSVIAKEPQRGRSGSRNGPRKRSFCSAVPIESSGGSPRPGTGERDRDAAVPVGHLLRQADARRARSPRRAGPLARRRRVAVAGPARAAEAEGDELLRRTGCSAGTGRPRRSASRPSGPDLGAAERADARRGAARWRRRCGSPRRVSRPSASGQRDAAGRLGELPAGVLARGVDAAGEQRERARLAHPLLDGVVLHEAVAAEHLDTVRCHEHRLLGGLEQGARAGLAGVGAAVEAPGRLVEQRARALDGGEHVDEQEGERLVVRDGAAEGDALLRVARGRSRTDARIMPSRSAAT